MEQHIAQATNLIFFIPTSIVAIFINWKNKLIDKKLAIIISICGIAGAIIGAIVATQTNVKYLRKCFGIFLGAIAIMEIYSYLKKYIFTRERNTNKKER